MAATILRYLAWASVGAAPFLVLRALMLLAHANEEHPPGELLPIFASVSALLFVLLRFLVEGVTKARGWQGDLATCRLILRLVLGAVAGVSLLVVGGNVLNDQFVTGDVLRDRESHWLMLGLAGAICGALAPVIVARLRPNLSFAAKCLLSLTTWAVCLSLFLAVWLTFDAANRTILVGIAGNDPLLEGRPLRSYLDDLSRGGDIGASAARDLAEGAVHSHAEKGETSPPFAGHEAQILARLTAALRQYSAVDDEAHREAAAAIARIESATEVHAPDENH